MFEDFKNTKHGLQKMKSCCCLHFGNHYRLQRSGGRSRPGSFVMDLSEFQSIEFTPFCFRDILPKTKEAWHYSKKLFLSEVLTLSKRKDRQTKMCVMVEMKKGTLCFSWRPLVTRRETEWQNEGQRAMEKMHPVTANEHTRMLKLWPATGEECEF